MQGEDIAKVPEARAFTREPDGERAGRKRFFFMYKMCGFFFIYAPLKKGLRRFSVARETLCCADVSGSPL